MNVLPMGLCVNKDVKTQPDHIIVIAVQDSGLSQMEGIVIVSIIEIQTENRLTSDSLSHRMWSLS